MTAMIGRSRPWERLRIAFEGLGGEPFAGGVVTVTGPAAVGKTRLAEELARRTDVPFLHLTIPHSPAPIAVRHAVAATLTSTLPDRGVFADVLVETWPEYFRLLLRSLPRDAPSLVVVDGAGAVGDGPVAVPDGPDTVPDTEPGAAARIARLCADALAARPCLLMLIDRDREALGPWLAGDADPGAGPPVLDRIELDPLGPLEIAAERGLDPIAALDAALVTGGLPALVSAWPDGASAPAALHVMFAGPLGAPAVLGELLLGPRYGQDSAARRLIAAMAHGHAARTAIGRAAAVPTATLDRTLRELTDSGIVAARLPLSARPSKETRYHLVNPYLDLWARFAAMDGSWDGGPASVRLARITAGWQRWRRRTAVHLVRATLGLVAAHERLPGARAVGAFWTRSGSTVVDLVGTDADPKRPSLAFVGAVKWVPHEPFDHQDLARLLAAREKVPGAGPTTPVVVVSLDGSAVGDAVAATLGPTDLLAAWQTIA